MRGDDRELGRRFDELRRRDAEGAPAFRAILGRARPQRPIPAIALASLATVIVAAIVVARWTRTSPPTTDAAVAQARAISAWIAPTDELLELSGLEISSSVPTLSLTSVSLPDVTTSPGDLQ